MRDVGPPYVIRLHENPGALPRAFLVPRSRLVIEGPVERGQLNAAQAGVLSRDFDPVLEVLISVDGIPPGRVEEEPGPPISSPVEFLEYGDQRIRLRADAPRDCWLFLSDTFYPGWVATVDGEEVPIHRANIAGRAVRVSAGVHEVEFDYRPGSLRLGFFLAALAALLLATLRLQRRILAALVSRKAPDAATADGTMAP
jgi:hypothetical protein